VQDRAVLLEACGQGSESTVDCGRDPVSNGISTPLSPWIRYRENVQCEQVSWSRLRPVSQQALNSTLQPVPASKSALNTTSPKMPSQRWPVTGSNVGAS